MFHILWSFILLIIMIIIIFCKQTIIYINQRIKNKEKTANYDVSVYDMQKWFKNELNAEEEKNWDKLSLCKTRIMRIQDKDIQNENICNQMSKVLCDGKVNLTKITIPTDSKISFYFDSNIKLVNGQSYCMHKPPPPLLSNITTTTTACNEVWGYWQFSQKYEHWMCKSKVPGIYNAAKNVFDACRPGRLYYNNRYIRDVSQKTPETFYSIEEQKKFYCDCPHGYISIPELSRTTCFKDPCFKLLPHNPFAKGYNKKTGECDCGEYYSHVDVDNLKSICTACPTPVYDSTNNTLKLYIKCGNNEVFPCVTSEELVKGCKEATLKIKPQNTSSSSFENLIFF